MSNLRYYVNLVQHSATFKLEFGTITCDQTRRTKIGHLLEHCEEFIRLVPNCLKWDLHFFFGKLLENIYFGYLLLLTVKIIPT